MLKKEKRPQSLYQYAVNTIKDRWPEAEPYIMKDPNTWNQYLTQFENKN